MLSTVDSNFNVMLSAIDSQIQSAEKIKMAGRTSQVLPTAAILVTY